MATKRQNNIECLRVLAMYLIIVGHVIGNAKLVTCAPALKQLSGGGNLLNFSILELLWIVSGIAVNCYVMITGYFLIERTDFRWKGFVGVWFQTLFYSAAIFAAVALLAGDAVGWKDILTKVTPIYHNTWWFITAYLCLLLVAPFLSLMAKSLTQRQYLLLLAVLFILVFEYPYGKLVSSKSPIVNFSFLFLLAGYIKLYGVPGVLARRLWLCIAVITLAMYIPAMAYNAYRLKCGQPLEPLASDRTFITLFLSAAVFCAFCSAQMEGRAARLIGRMAPYTLGIYLVHCHPSLQRYIWVNTLPAVWPEPQWLSCPLNILGSAAVIFAACMAVDAVRKRIFGFLRVPRMVEAIAAKLPKLNNQKKQTKLI